MNARKKFTAIMLVSMLMLTGFVSSAAAVTSGDVAQTIKEPEADTDYDVGGFLSSGLPYAVELENNVGTEKVTVNTYVEVTNGTNNVVSTWVNGTEVNRNSKKTIEGTISVGDLNLNKDAYTDYDVNVESTFNGNSTSVDKTNSVIVGLKKSQMFQMLLSFVLVIALIGSIKEFTS